MPTYSFINYISLIQALKYERPMRNDGNLYLIAAAAMTGVAALLHVGCIIFGGDWYRFFGAGEQMVQMDESGSLIPAAMTSVVCAVLSVFTLYALSGARVAPQLPLLRPVLLIISSIFLLRGILFVPLMPIFPGNSLTFWLATSSICLLMGTAYAVGTWRSWQHIGTRPR